MDIFKEISDAIQEGLNSIFERWDLVLWQIAATVILIIVVRIFLWKPITRYLEQRQEALSKELYEAAHERERVAQIRYRMLREQLVPAITLLVYHIYEVLLLRMRCYQIDASSWRLTALSHLIYLRNHNW